MLWKFSVLDKPGADPGQTRSTLEGLYIPSDGDTVYSQVLLSVSGICLRCCSAWSWLSLQNFVDVSER